MKKLTLGIVVGLIVGLVIGTAAVGFGSSPIKLIVDGEEITPDVPPQMIDGRVMVPARFVAEPLGADVEWDGTTNSVKIKTTKNDTKKEEPRSDVDSEIDTSTEQITNKENELTEWWPPKEINVVGISSELYPRERIYWMESEELYISPSLAADILLDNDFYRERWRNTDWDNLNLPRYAPPGHESKQGIRLSDLNKLKYIDVSWDDESRTLYVN